MTNLIDKIDKKLNEARTFVATFSGTTINIKGFGKDDDGHLAEDIYDAIGKSAKAIEKKTKKKIVSIQMVIK